MAMPCRGIRSAAPCPPAANTRRAATRRRRRAAPGMRGALSRSFPRKRESKGRRPWPWVPAFAGTNGCRPFGAGSLDHLVGAGGERRRNVEAERFGGLGVYNQLEFVWRLHRQVSRLLASENAIDIGSGAPKQI